MKVLSYKDSGYTRFVNKLNRRAVPAEALRETVAGIVADVQKRGNKAVFELTEKFDGIKLTARTMFVTEAEIAEAEALVEPSVKKAIEESRKNVHAFAKRSMRKNWNAKNRQGAQVGERDGSPAGGAQSILTQSTDEFDGFQRMA